MGRPVPVAQCTGGEKVDMWAVEAGLGRLVVGAGWEERIVDVAVVEGDAKVVLGGNNLEVEVQMARLSYLVEGRNRSREKL